MICNGLYARKKKREIRCFTYSLFESNKTIYLKIVLFFRRLTNIRGEKEKYNCDKRGSLTKIGGNNKNNELLLISSACRIIQFFFFLNSKYFKLIPTKPPYLKQFIRLYLNGSLGLLTAVLLMEKMHPSNFFLFGKTMEEKINRCWRLSLLLIFSKQTILDLGAV